MHSASGNGRRRPFVGKKIGRREFIKLGGAGLAGAALLGVTGCGGGSTQDQAGTEIVFSFFPDPTGSVQKLIDRFNEQNEGIRVKLREMPRRLRAALRPAQHRISGRGDEHRRDRGRRRLAGQFAANGYIADLSDRFAENEHGAFLPATVEANTYEGKVYGVPWYTDAGML